MKSSPFIMYYLFPDKHHTKNKVFSAFGNSWYLLTALKICAKFWLVVGVFGWFWLAVVSFGWLHVL